MIDTDQIKDLEKVITYLNENDNPQKGYISILVKDPDALLKALSGCLPTCFTEQVFRRALSSLIKNMRKLLSLPKMARGKSLVVVACL